MGRGASGRTRNSRDRVSGGGRELTAAVMDRVLARRPEEKRDGDDDRGQPRRIVGRDQGVPLVRNQENAREQGL